MMSWSSRSRKRNSISCAAWFAKRWRTSGSWPCPCWWRLGRARTGGTWSEAAAAPLTVRRSCCRGETRSLPARRQRVVAFLFLGSQRLLDGAGNCLGEHVHARFGLGFDHHSGQTLGTGVTDDHAAVPIEFALGGFNGALHFGNLIQGDFLAYAHVLYSLRENPQIGNQFPERLAGSGHHFHDTEGGEQSVAGGGFAVPENDVAGLLATERRAGFHHFFQNILVADAGAEHADARVPQSDFQPHIRHGGGNHGVVAQRVAGLHLARGQQQDPVPVDHPPLTIAEQGPVGIAIEGDAQV